MNLTLAIWLGLFAILALLTFKRPAWGVSLYMLTFFAEPLSWWWGKGTIGYFRWNLVAGIGLLAAVLLSRLSGAAPPERWANRGQRWVGWFAVAILVNATAVHVLLAPDPDVSSKAYWLLAKFVLLFFLMVAAIRTRDDLRIILLSILLGAAYIGYEVTMNDRGHMRSGRLEGVGASGVARANELAALMLAVLPITGAFFLAGRRWEKLMMLFVAPLIANVLLLCNSRGAFLSGLLAAGALLLFTPLGVRRQIVKLLGLGAVAVWLLLGDPYILDRFVTAFVSEEERDRSAESRLEYWKAGLNMISDHPLGAGGHGFNRVYGPKYIKEVNDESFASRAVHNGFINEACEWGVQGFLLRMAFVGGGLFLVWHTSRSPRSGSDPFDCLLACTTFTAMVGFLGTCTFGDLLDAEWGYWLLALSVAHSRLVSSAPPVTLPTGVAIACHRHLLEALSAAHGSRPVVIRGMAVDVGNRYFARKDP